jgi:hypothetical protein
VAQTVTVTGVDDAMQDGSIAYTIVLGTVASADANYAGVDPADVAATNADDDGAGITVTPVAGLVTTEAGGTASFGVVLRSQPTASVVFAVASSDSTEGVASVASLTFTALDWNVQQTITVTGVDDAVADGATTYHILLGAAASGDPEYAGIDPVDVDVTNADNDGPGITVTPVAGLATTEAGGSASFTVMLDSQPAAPVAIPVASSDAGEGVASVASLVFTATDWNVPQTVTVTGVDDPVADGPVAYNVILDAATSADPNYNDMDAADVAVVNADDDAAGITVAPTAGLATTETGGTASFTVVLRSQPTANVVVPVASSDASEGVASVAGLTFTATDWNVPQTVTVTGIDDAVVDGAVAYSVNLGVATSADATYNGMDVPDPAVVNADDDGPASR